MQPSAVKGLHTVPQTNPTYLNMQPCELTDLYSLPGENLDHEYEYEYPHHFNTYSSNTFLINPQIHHQGLELSSNASSSLSNKISNSIEANQDQTYLCINHDRKLKRLISNRESARRSRMRKRKQLDDLRLQILHIQNLYRKLTDQFINLLESNRQILQENAQLKEEVSFFRKIVDGIPFRDIDDVCRDSPCVRAEGSNQFMTSSMDLLQ